MSEDSMEVQAQPAVKAAAAAVEAEPDGHPHWRATLYTVWVAQSFAIIGFSFVMPFIPFYIRELGVTDPRSLPIWAGLMVSGSGMTMSLVAPLWGWVADRYGRKLMVQRAMFGGAVILSLMGLCRNAYQLLALRMIQGAITGTVPASIALISSVVPSAQMGFSLGLMQMAVFGGSSIGPYLGGLIAQHFGYRVPFGITGSLLLAAGLLVLFGARERFRRPLPEERARAGSLRDVLVTPGLLALLVVYMMLNLTGSFVGPIVPLFVEEVMGMPGRAASATGLILAVSGVTAAVASVFVGRISDRFGYRRLLISCTCLAGAMSFPLAAASSVNQLLVLRAIFGLGAGGMIPSMNAMVATIVPRGSLGRAYGLTTTAAAFGWATGPIIGGWAASVLGLRMPFVIMGGLLVALALAQCWTLPKTR